MSPTAALELDRPAARVPEASADRRPDGMTLEDLVLSVSDELAASGSAECPVCRGPLAPAGCASCGAHLS